MGFQAPDIKGLTPEELVDRLAKTRSLMNKAKKLEAFYKEAVKARRPSHRNDETGENELDLEMPGNEFQARFVDDSRTNLPVDVVRNELPEYVLIKEDAIDTVSLDAADIPYILGKNWITEHETSTPFVKVEIEPKPKAEE